MSEHTPTPWAVASNDRAIIREVPGMADGYDHYMVGVLSSHSVIGHGEARANAAFIIKAVNNHQRMAEALQNLMGVYDTPLSRRRFPPDEFMKAALDNARDLLALLIAPRHT